MAFRGTTRRGSQRRDRRKSHGVGPVFRRIRSPSIHTIGVSRPLASAEPIPSAQLDSSEHKSPRSQTRLTELFICTLIASETIRDRSLHRGTAEAVRSHDSAARPAEAAKSDFSTVAYAADPIATDPIRPTDYPTVGAAVAVAVSSNQTNGEDLSDDE